MSELLFYEKPVALSREQHKGLRYSPVKDFSFSKEVNSVPITGLEFFEASRDMTVLFGKTDDDRYYPVALMSLRKASHDLVREDGSWAGRYIPAFIRRYPFALTEESVVCLDEASEAFAGEQGEPLFDEQGENSTMLERVIGFLKQYDREARRTREFCEAAAKKGLFKSFDVQVGGKEKTPVRLQGLHVIDARKFSELSGDTLELWFTRGWLGWVYAHLHSIGALGSLSREIVEAGED